MRKFIYYYITELFNRWKTLLILLPAVAPQFKELLLFYFPDNKTDIENYINLAIKFKSYTPWLLLLLFITANVKITYILWIRLKQNENISFSPDLNDEYGAIAYFIKEISPANYSAFLIRINAAYKAYTNQNVKNMITHHVFMYTFIEAILKNCYTEKTLIRSTNTTKINDSFNENFKSLKQLNDSCGNNEELPEHYIVNKLISDINTNINTMFSYTKKL